MPYVFFDVETTGLNTRFDQIIQFAAVYTDEDFNERERIDIRCRIQPNLIPSIEALAITQTSMPQLFNELLPSHYEMILAIHEKLNSWSPATFVGWNTIRFDEEFLRSAFYQNLLPPFVTNTNGSNRFDVLRLARAASILAPDCINVPIAKNGNKTFALNRLAAANGHENQKTHDALSDVLATIYIAKLLKIRARAIWSFGNRLSNRSAAMELVTAASPAVTVDSYGGKTNCYPFIKIGNDPQIPGNVVVADLRFDFSQFQSLSDNQKDEWLFQSPRPIHRIKCNASPVIMPFDELDEFEDYNLNELSAAAEQLADNGHLCEELTDYYLIATNKEFPNKFVEEQIYIGFPDRSTKEQLERFHLITWRDRSEMLLQIEDKRYQKLGLRLIAEHAPEYLSENQIVALAKFAKFRKLGFQNEYVPWRTLESAQQELSDFKLKSNVTNEKLVYDYEQYLNAI